MLCRYSFYGGFESMLALGLGYSWDTWRANFFSCIMV
jgi:hypothetical protein